MYLGSFQCFVQAERGQYGRQPFGQHGFTRTRRPYQYGIVPTGSSNFECTLHILLSLHIIEVYLENILSVKKLFTGIYLQRFNSTVAIEEIDHFADISHAIYVEIV